MLRRKFPRMAQHLLRLLVSPLIDEPSRREGHEKDPDAQHYRGHELQRERDAPRGLALRRAGAADEVRAVVDPEGDHDAERDRELLECDKRAADFWRGDLGAGGEGRDVSIWFDLI